MWGWKVFWSANLSKSKATKMRLLRTLSCHVCTIVWSRDSDHRTERLEKAENVPHEVSPRSYLLGQDQE